jgi:hypothetical protein
MLLLKAQTNLSEEHEHKNFISQNSISEAWEIFFKIFTNYQINLSEAWEHFFKNDKAHRAKKDISEALEQFHSSKNLNEAYEPF